MPSMLRKNRCKRVSCYQPLWDYIRNSGELEVRLTYEEIEKISGRPLDHVFLFSRDELLRYGYCVYRLSARERAVWFYKVV